MRILVVLPTAQGVYPAEAEQRRIDRCKSYASATTEIEVGFPVARSGFMPFGGGEGSAFDRAHNHYLMADRLILAEKEGFDAALPFGMIDFGVELARSRVNIPIVGQTQAAYAMASMMGSLWGVISYQSTGHAMMRQQARTYGFEQFIVGWGAAEMSNADMPKQPQMLFDRFVSEGKRLVKTGAELIVCHGMSMCPIEFPAKAYADAIGVPVVEGLGSAVAMAEAWVRNGTPYSHVRHPGIRQSLTGD
jgi:allantoin racemase